MYLNEISTDQLGNKVGYSLHEYKTFRKVVSQSYDCDLVGCIIFISGELYLCFEDITQIKKISFYTLFFQLLYAIDISRDDACLELKNFKFLRPTK